MLLALVLAAAVQPQSIASPAVKQVQISSKWGGLGNDAPFNLTIDASEAASGEKESVTALVSALQSPIVNAPSRTQILETRLLDSTEDAFRECLGDTLDIPAVHKQVQKLYSDQRNQEAWLDAYYVKKTIFHTDDYPHVTVTVTFSDGRTIKAESDSQTALMLPFHVTVDGQEKVTYNAGLPRALGDIIAGNLNADRLSGYGVYGEFGKHLCYAYQASLGHTAIRSYLPHFYAAMARDGWTVGGRDGLTLSRDLSLVQGEIRRKSWPSRVTFAIIAHSAPLDRQGLENASIQMLSRVNVTTKRIVSIPWVSKWLTGPNGPTLTLQWLANPRYEISADDIYANFRKHDPALYADLKANLDETVYAKIWDRSHGSSSDWLFMPDKALLTAFSDKSTQGALDGKHLRSWSDFADMENDPTFEFRRVIIILDPQGNIVKALP